MRMILVLGLVMTTSCSFLLAPKPSPTCEETGADLADGTTAVVSGLLALIVGVTALDECGDGCGGDGRQLVGTSVGLTATTVAFAASAVHGSRANAACRRARANATE